MSEREYRYFIASGRSLEICRQIHDERNAAYEELRAIMAEVGADNAYGQPRIVGLTFPQGKKLDGWRSYVRGYSNYLMPEKRNKTLAPLRARIEAIRLPGAWELNSRLGFDWCQTNEQAHRGSGNIILSAHAETIGDKVIIHAPVDYKGNFGTPADAEPIKASEYWLLKEQSDAAHPSPEPGEAE